MTKSPLFHGLLTRPAAAGFSLNDAQRELGGAECLELVNRIASGFLAAGLLVGERIAIRLGNRVEVALAAFAASRMGAVFVIIGSDLPQERIRYILTDCGATGLICAASDDLARQAAESIAALKIVFSLDGSPPGCMSWEELEKTRPEALSDVGKSDDLAALFYTSGSTGFPKGVMLSHRNLRFTTWSISTYLENRATDRLLVFLPLSFDYGFFQLSTALHAGASIFLVNQFFAAPALEQIKDLAITGLPLVPTMVAMILQLRQLSQHALPSLRYLTNTAQTLPVAAIRSLSQHWPHVAIYSMYGLTESTRTLFLDPKEIGSHPDSVGRAIPGTRVWLERDDRSQPGFAEPGELVVTGEHVMLGYWQDQAATAARLRPGTDGGRELLTGDLFVADAEGRYYFQGRKDDLIKVQGHKIYPLEVEREVLTYPGVNQACLVGRPHSMTGNKLVLYLVLAPDEKPAKGPIIRFLQGLLEDLKVPREIYFRENLPLTSTGKVDRKRLREEE